MARKQKGKKNAQGSQVALFGAAMFSKPRRLNMSFTEAKNDFDNIYKNQSTLPQSIVTVDGKIVADIRILDDKGKPLEEYYKWQFVHALIKSGLFFRDYIGTEVHFPKGTKGAAPIKIDACIFDTNEWLSNYLAYREKGDSLALEFLRKHCVAVIDFKRHDEDIEQIVSEQLRAYIKEPEASYVLGILYAAERLYLFQRVNGSIARYDDSKNDVRKPRIGERLSLDLTDGYHAIPTLDELKKRIQSPALTSRAGRTINDLDVITSIASVQVKDALSEILKVMDKASLLNQKGYELLIQVLALKIFDEKQNDRFPDRKLRFYVEDEEAQYKSLNESEAQTFIKRLQAIYDDAEEHYSRILKEPAINWKNENHVRCVVHIVKNFQDYSFVRSQKSDLYQLVFYNFATPFKKEQKAQFLTPLPIIDFLVRIVNPRGHESVLDPCVGIADFLSFSYINSNPPLDDSTLWGVDNDESMVMLATLNMLLNGDGKAHLLYAPDKGSLVWKVRKDGELVSLIPELHRNGNWDSWNDDTKLMKLDVVLTNPPFGRGRSYETKTSQDKKIAELYELWNLNKEKTKSPKSAQAQSIDLGILFLENAYRMLDRNGRMGIVLSNSIAAIDQWRFVHNWFRERMRIVALFDLPAEVFAETGVNPTLIVAYKPNKDELERLKSLDYEVFVREIPRIGYEKRKVDRNVIFEPKYKLNPETFDIEIDMNGNPILDEGFSAVLHDFRTWAATQEETLQRLFLQ